MFLITVLVLNYIAQLLFCLEDIFNIQFLNFEAEQPKNYFALNYNFNFLIIIETIVKLKKK